MVLRPLRPLRRSEGLLVDRVESTTMIVDTARNRAHSLTPEVALVWSLCDGARDAAGLAQASSLSADAVSAALAELERVGLLEASGMTRRRMLQVGAGVGGAVLISSVALPSAAAAASNPGGGTGGGGTGGTYSGSVQPPGTVDFSTVDADPNGQGFYIGDGYYMQSLAMPFTVGSSGNLTGVGVASSYYGSDISAVLTVQITAYGASAPGTVLRSVDVPSSALPTHPAYAITYITFTTPLPVQAGDQYYVVQAAPDTVDDVWYNEASGTVGNFLYNNVNSGGTWMSDTIDPLCQYETFVQ